MILLSRTEERMSQRTTWIQIEAEATERRLWVRQSMTAWISLKHDLQMKTTAVRIIICYRYCCCCMMIRWMWMESWLLEPLKEDELHWMVRSRYRETWVGHSDLIVSIMMTTLIHSRIMTTTTAMTMTMTKRIDV